MACVARAVCLRWTYDGVSSLARDDGMLWVAGGQQRGPRRARASMCVPRTCELSVSVTSQSCMRGACHGCTSYNVAYGLGTLQLVPGLHTVSTHCQ